MNLKQMQAFYFVMLTGSVTGAARQMNVTQPAVSIMLRHCEDQLGIKLFVRNRGRLLPSPEAMLLYPDVKNIFDRIDEVSRNAEGIAFGKLKNLTIAATYSVASGPLAEAVAQFVRREPSVNIAIRALPTPDVVSKVVERSAEFGVGFGPVNHAALDWETIFRVRMTCVMPSGHPLASKEVIQLTDLDGHDIVSYAPQTEPGVAINRACDEQGVRLRRSCEVNYALAAYHLASRGLGVAIVDPIMAGLYLNSTPLMVSRPLEPAIHMQLGLITPHNRPLTKHSNQIIKSLRDELDRTPQLKIVHVT